MKKTRGSTSIAQKITQSITGIAITCSAVIGLVGIICLIFVGLQCRNMYERDVVPLTSIHKVQQDFQSIRSNLKSMALEAATGESSGTDYRSAISKLQTDMDNQLNVYSKNLYSKAARDNYKSINSNVANYETAVGNVENYIESKQIGKAMELMNNNKSLSDDTKDKVGYAFTLSTNQAARQESTAIIILLIAIFVVLGCAVAFTIVSKVIGKRTANGISLPIRKMVDAAKMIADGNLDIDLNIDSRDETGILADALAKIAESLNLLKKDVKMLIGGALEGKLDARADESKHKGDYKSIIQGVNKMLDTVKEPLDEASEFINRLADGEDQEEIENNYKGYYAVLIDNINKVRYSIDVLVNESNKLAEAGVGGNLDVRGDESRLKGTYANIIHGVNETFDAIKHPLDVASEFIKGLANGAVDRPIENTYSGYYAGLIDNLNSVFSSLSVLHTEAVMLSEAGINGDLSARSDVSRLPGHYAEILAGMNGILEAVSEPLNEAGHILKNVSSYNDFTQQMTGSYKGEFEELSDSINRVIDQLHNVEEVFTYVSSGDLSLLDRYSKIGRRSENDNLVPAAVKMMTSINDLIAESNRLAAAAAQGDLGQKGDEEKFEGGYRQIIQGFNSTIKSVIEPIREAAKILYELSQSNLSTEMEGEYNGEYNTIKKSINDVVTAFNEVLGELNIAADQVSGGSKQVADASQSLSQGAAEQASSVEELTSSVTEIAAKIRQNASDASKASTLSAKAESEAVSGNDKMTEMLSSMKDINDSSVNISKIIKVIDDIAFQTNILSLNAAVEAARAGQYGKGFAVVAEEVRNLAAKSAEAAKETTDLIESSISKVNSGTRIANETADMLNQISESIKEASALVGNIAEASNEQATAIAQIDKGISQVSTVVQTNSATAEESAASSEELSGQAESLMRLVGGFKLKDGYRAEHTGGYVGKKPAAEKKKPNPAETAKPKPVKEFGKY